MILLIGRDDNFYDKFAVSPDNKLLVFLGKDGYLPLVSNKVSIAAMSNSGTAYRPITEFDTDTTLFSDQAMDSKPEDEWRRLRCSLHARQPPFALSRK